MGAWVKSTRVFIDCDDLKNLEMLFEYVGRQTDTVVVLFSKELLLRPWCVGELVTAHLSLAVKITPVLFPDFVAPDKNFIRQYDASVDIRCLAPHGIDTSMIQARFMTG